DYDLDAGHTTLVSPIWDLHAIADPVIGWWRWFYSQDPGTGQPDGNDYLAVQASQDGGITWVPVDTLHGMHNAWEEQQIRLKDYLSSFGQVRLRFIAGDEGPNSTVEAAVDDIAVYDASQAQAGVPP